MIKNLDCYPMGILKSRVKVGVTILYLPICPIASFPGGEMKVSCLPLHHHEEK